MAKTNNKKLLIPAIIVLFVIFFAMQDRGNMKIKVRYYDADGNLIKEQSLWRSGLKLFAMVPCNDGICESDVYVLPPGAATAVLNITLTMVGNVNQNVSFDQGNGYENVGFNLAPGDKVTFQTENISLAPSFCSRESKDISIRAESGEVSETSLLLWQYERTGYDTFDVDYRHDLWLYHEFYQHIGEVVYERWGEEVELYYVFDGATNMASAYSGIGHDRYLQEMYSQNLFGNKDIWLPYHFDYSGNENSADHYYSLWYGDVSLPLDPECTAPHGGMGYYECFGTGNLEIRFHEDDPDHAYIYHEGALWQVIPYEGPVQIKVEGYVRLEEITCS